MSGISNHEKTFRVIRLAALRVRAADAAILSDRGIRAAVEEEVGGWDFSEAEERAALRAYRGQDEVDEKGRLVPGAGS